MPAAAPGEVRKIGILAGSGALPGRLLRICDEKSIETFVVAFERQTDKSILQGRDYIQTRLGAAGRIMVELRARGITDLILIGAIRRPSFSELRPDLKAIKFMSRLGMRTLGDDGLLSALRRELEKEGFRLFGLHEIASELLAREGAYGRLKPRGSDWEDIRRAFIVSQALGEMDVGQSVVIQEGLILGVEAIEGTDALIERCAAYRRRGAGGILVKSCKPQQDLALDMPTIGPRTIEKCAEFGIRGVVFQAGRTLIVDEDELIEKADRLKIFVTGIRDINDAA